MKIQVLFSGSSGNSIIFSMRKELFLLDVGVTYSKLKKALDYNNYKITDIKYVIISHEHTDHIRCLKKILENEKIILYINEKTYNHLPSKNKPEKKNHIVFYKENIIFEDLDIIIKVYNSSHDCINGNYFSFYSKIDCRKLFAYICDTGYINNKYLNDLYNHEVYLIESNYETELLLKSEYPWHIQQRILSDTGHLSNNYTINILKKIIGNNTKFLYFIHLSENSNNKNILEKKIKNMLRNLNREDILFSICLKENYKEKSYVFRK